MEMRCYRKILHISYKDHITNEEVNAKIQQAIGPHKDHLTIVKRRKLQWYGFATSFLHFSLQACPFPDVVFPPLPLSALSSSPFHCALHDLNGRHDHTTAFASRFDRQVVFVWSNCLLDLGTDFLVGNMVFV